MHDQFDVSLEDDDLLGEVELTTTLIIAASEADEHLPRRRSTGSWASTPRQPQRLTPRPPAPPQQVANSTGPLVRSDSTYCPGPGCRSSTTAARRGPLHRGTGRRSPRPARAPVRAASVARVSASVRAASSSSKAIATRTRAVRHPAIANPVRVHLARPREQRVGLGLVVGVGGRHRQGPQA